LVKGKHEETKIFPAKSMNTEIVLTGLISLLIGLIGELLTKPQSAREKRDNPGGLTEPNSNTQNGRSLLEVPCLLSMEYLANSTFLRKSA